MGSLKYKSKPNNIIQCEYEIEDSEINEEINIITEDNENQEDINKLNIYYIKDFGGVKKRIKIGKKQKFPEKKIHIIIIVDKSIKNLKGLFKDCKHLKDINFDFFDFSRINNWDNLLQGCNLRPPKINLDKYKKEFPNTEKLDFTNIYGNNNNTAQDTANNTPRNNNESNQPHTDSQNIVNNNPGNNNDNNYTEEEEEKKDNDEEILNMNTNQNVISTSSDFLRKESQIRLNP
jgi:hypothetical protein